MTSNNDETPPEITTGINPERSYFFLKELVELPEVKKLGFTTEALLDFGANEKLTLSFAVAGRYIISGDYHQNKEVVENPPHYDDVASGPLPLPSVEIWKIIADGETELEYLYRNEFEFSRIERDDRKTLPVIGRDQILVTARDWKLFINGKSPSPMAISEIIYKTKKSETLIIGALAYLYGTIKGKTNSIYCDSSKTETGGVVIQAITDDVVNLLSTSEVHYPSAGDKNVQTHISQGLKVVVPVVEANNEASLNKAAVEKAAKEKAATK